MADIRLRIQASHFDGLPKNRQLECCERPSGDQSACFCMNTGSSFLRVARDSPEARDDGPTVNETELLCQVQTPVREGVAPA
jgi:hypothetical protein